MVVAVLLSLRSRDDGDDVIMTDWDESDSAPSVVFPACKQQGWSKEFY